MGRLFAQFKISKIFCNNIAKSLREISCTWNRICDSPLKYLNYMHVIIIIFKILSHIFLFGLFF